jgi:hypothetical protein
VKKKMMAAKGKETAHNLKSDNLFSSSWRLIKFVLTNEIFSV